MKTALLPVEIKILEAKVKGWESLAEMSISVKDFVPKLIVRITQEFFKDFEAPFNPNDKRGHLDVSNWQKVPPFSDFDTVNGNLICRKCDKLIMTEGELEELSEETNPWDLVGPHVKECKGKP